MLVNLNTSAVRNSLRMPVNPAYWYRTLATFSLLSTLTRGLSVPPHPRVLLNDTGLAALRVSIAAHSEHANYVAQLLAGSLDLLTRPPTPYSNCTVVGACRNAAVFGSGPGTGYLDVGSASTIMVTCAFLHRLNGTAGRTPWANRAIAELLHVAREWPHWYWPVGQALERSEVAWGAAVAYDWLFELLSPTERADVETAIGTLALDTRMRDEREGAWWITDSLAANWGINANAPLLGAAVALIDVPEWTATATAAISAITAALPTPVALWEPEGVWAEGVAYSNYALLSLSQGCEALAAAGMPPALGACDWLGTARGPCAAGRAVLLSSGPTGNIHNFGDCHVETTVSGVLFYASRVCEEPGYAAAARAIRAAGGAKLEDVLYFSADGSAADWSNLLPSAVTLARGSPRTHVAMLRSSLWSWGGPAASNATWIALKGGDNAYHSSAANNHGHIDVGSFVFEALGVRWAIDLGPDAYDYPLLAYFGRFRHAYYFVSSAAHNVLRFDDDAQHRLGYGVIAAANTSGTAPWVRLDVTTAYGGAATVMRTYRLLGGGPCAAAQTEDMWVHASATVATWVLHTAASVTRAPGGELVLTAAGGGSGAPQLVLTATTTAGATAPVWNFQLLSVPPPQATTYGKDPIWVVTATVGAASGALNVTLTPTCKSAST